MQKVNNRNKGPDLTPAPEKIKAAATASTVWRAIYVNSRSEKKLVNVLLAKGVEAYVPIIKTMKQWSDRKKIVEVPLLHGYVFIRIPESGQEQVLHTAGVVRFVRSEGKIAQVREEEIARLKQLVELGYQVEASPINRRYNEGDKVKIRSGVLKGVEGFVTDAPEGKQVEVLLESIGHCIRVRVPKEILKEV